jgi:hypothetical protein
LRGDGSDKTHQLLIAYGVSIAALFGKDAESFFFVRVREYP